MKLLPHDDWIDYTFGLHGRGLVCGEYTDFPGSAYDALENCIIFLKDARPTLARVPRRNAEAAMTAFPSIDGYGGLMSYPELALADRFRLADAQTALFRDVFATDPFGSTAFMWWEWLPGATWNDGPAVMDDPQMCGHMMGVYEAIFAIDSEECQRSALHGVNELPPDWEDNTLKRAVARLLGSRPGRLSARVLEYAATVADGNAQ